MPRLFDSSLQLLCLCTHRPKFPVRVLAIVSEPAETRTASEFLLEENRQGLSSRVVERRYGCFDR